MRGLSVQKLADRDAQEAKGYHDLLQTVFEEYSNIPLSENTILELHSRLLKYSTKDVRHRGAYKTLENNVEMRDTDGKLLSVLFETSPAYLTPKHMQKLIAWANGVFAENRYHPVAYATRLSLEK